MQYLDRAWLQREMGKPEGPPRMVALHPRVVAGLGRLAGEMEYTWIMEALGVVSTAV